MFETEDTHHLFILIIEKMAFVKVADTAISPKRTNTFLKVVRLPLVGEDMNKELSSRLQPARHFFQQLGVVLHVLKHLCVEKDSVIIELKCIIIVHIIKNKYLINMNF